VKKDNKKRIDRENAAFTTGNYSGFAMEIGALGAALNAQSISYEATVSASKFAVRLY